MPNIIKNHEQKCEVKSYDYIWDFTNEKPSDDDEADLFCQDDCTNEESDDTLNNDDINNEYINDAIYESEKIIEEAKMKAEEIYNAAVSEIEEMKRSAIEEGRKSGFDIGYEAGFQKAGEENKEWFENEGKQFLSDLKNIINDVELKKDEVLEKYCDDLKNISVAVAEKVIQISLKSSGEIIKKMILSATEKIKTKEWAKIYISKCDAELMVKGNIDVLYAISHLSKNLKVVVMENESQGTCIIELPDEIIDASASTQVENIKEILNSGGVMYGGKTSV